MNIDDLIKSIFLYEHDSGDPTEPNTPEQNGYMRGIAATLRYLGKRGVGPLDADAVRMKLGRWLTLLQDIVACATRNPPGLTAFNSPILQRAVQEIYLHNNPDAEDDEQARQRAIWLELSEAQKRPVTIVYKEQPSDEVSPLLKGALFGLRNCAESLEQDHLFFSTNGHPIRAKNALEAMRLVHNMIGEFELRLRSP